MNKKTKIALITIIVLFIAGMAFYPKIKESLSTGEDAPQKSQQGKEKNSGNSRNKGPLNVNAQILKYQDLSDVYRSTGRLIPDEEVDLAFETSGKITNIYFNEGSAVKKGTLLAKINDKPLQAELKKLEAQLPLAKDRVFRQKSLLAKDAVSQEAYESVNTDLEKLYADIELVKARIAQTELRAPFDGIIGLRFVSEGAFANSTTVISKLTKITPLKIEFSVNERQTDGIKPGTIVEFSTVNDLNTYKATVYAIESNLDRQTLSLKARARYPNPGGHLKPGHSAKVEIKLQEIRNTIAIPSLSLIAEMGKDIAYVYKNGKAHQVVLKKGMRTNSAIQIIDGLNKGDTLIVSGVMQLRDGMPVVIENYINSEIQ